MHSPSKRTMLIQRPSDAHDVQKTLKRRPNNVLCSYTDAFCNEREMKLFMHVQS